MAMYYCKGCERLLDDDYHPMHESELCPACDLEREELDTIEFVRGQEACREGIPQKSTDSPSFTRGYGAEYTREQVATWRSMNGRKI